VCSPIPRPHSRHEGPRACWTGKAERSGADFVGSEPGRPNAAHPVGGDTGSIEAIYVVTRPAAVLRDRAPASSRLYIFVRATRRRRLHVPFLTPLAMDPWWRHAKRTLVMRGPSKTLIRHFIIRNFISRTYLPTQYEVKDFGRKSHSRRKQGTPFRGTPSGLVRDIDTCCNDRYPRVSFFPLLCTGTSFSRVARGCSRQGIPCVIACVPVPSALKCTTCSLLRRQALHLRSSSLYSLRLQQQPQSVEVTLEQHQKLRRIRTVGISFAPVLCAWETCSGFSPTRANFERTHHVSQSGNF
jgi:hypothetical protein